MYNDNPTIQDLPKVVDETKQGEVFGAEFAPKQLGKKQFYIESYGCQMNFSDSEIVASILGDAGYHPTRNMEFGGFDPRKYLFHSRKSGRDRAQTPPGI